MSEYNIRPLPCMRGGMHIFAREYLPGRSGPLPAVILSHGFSANADGLDAYARLFAENGYAAYTFDFCGGSKPGTGRSDGDTLGMTLASERADLIAMADAVTALPYIDAGRLVLFGASQGGFVSGLAAAKLQDRVWRLIMLYPALCIPDHARMGCLGGSSYPEGNPPDILECPNGMRLSRANHDEAAAMDPFLEIARYHGPVLILHGTADRVVHDVYGIKARDAYQPGQCHLQLVRGADHGFPEEMNGAVVDSCLLFLDGQSELLTIPVFLTGAEELPSGGGTRKTAVHFTGWCDTPLFHGAILPGAVDLQTRTGDGAPVLHATYALEGVDADGKPCRIDVDNQKRGDRFHPLIRTNSPALAFLQDQELTAVLEFFPGGLTVRIFGRMPALS